MNRIKIFLRTLSPIVLSSASNSTIMTETHSTISGSIIRGVLASRFVKVKNLVDEAHNKTFREIFFGGLRFLPANPELKGKRSFVLPLSLQSGKAGTPDGDKVADLLDGTEPPLGYKSFRGFGVLDGGKIFTARVKTNMFMHMSRSGQGFVDGKEVFERLTGKSEVGQIYNYEAIDGGQTFSGEIIGAERLLRALLDGLNLNGGQLTAYVGRSRFTQYGKCLLSFGEVEPLPAQHFGEKIFLRLDTPLIPAEDCFLSAAKVLEDEVKAGLGKKFSVGKVYAAGVEVENFVVPWGMKRPRVAALAAGTVFELKADALSKDEKKSLVEKIFAGIGTRTEEGFGQLRLWTPSDKFTRGKLDDEEIPRPKNFSAKTVALAKKILTAQLLEQTRIYAHEDAEKLRPQLKGGNFTHFFARLEGLLTRVDKTNLRANIAAQLQADFGESKGSKLFEEHLKNLKMANGQKFFDVLTEKAPLPIDSRSMSEEIDLRKIKPLFDDLKLSPDDLSKDAIYLEYLTNYFRFARKLASTKGGAARE